jgi:hypothetical protein
MSLLAHPWTVRFRRVDQVDADVDAPPQHGNGFVVVLWGTPRPRPGDAHGTESESVDREISTKRNVPL